MRTGLFCLLFLQPHCLLGRSVFGDGLGSFGDGVLGQFSRQQKSDGCLDFSGCNGRPLVVVCEARSFGGNSFKDVVDEAVHDGHGFRRNTSIGVDLFQHLVNVDAVRLLPPLLFLFISFRDGLLSLSGLLCCFTAGFWCHFLFVNVRRIFGILYINSLASL